MQHTPNRREPVRAFTELGFDENGNGWAPIVSPISCTAVDIGTASGEMQRSLEISSGITTVANLNTVWVTGDVFE